ncbi:hypothetical protein AQUCO_05400121v1 [Aquilegia coerulea]|uniref:Uncharacterized protein n=1 Tax=Aquilegia coerulea TaxID=218851 RepID=A0A2G5CHM8_AQUCA|nr:hypothetical protein AQUCO_05400121v1 [Aquilegia coerulea]
MRRREEGEGEGESRSESENYIKEIETTAETLDEAVIFHVIKEIVGFVLYMHQQIPSLLQDLNQEFDELQTGRKDLELVLTQTEVKASSRRKHIGRMREVKQGIKRLEKLMSSVSVLQTAIQLMLHEIHSIQGVMLVLGSSPVRPQHVYEMLFSHGRVVSDHGKENTKSKVAEALSRKAIRALISSGAGSVSYAGPTKLFIMVKAPATLNLPLHFLPKRDFRYSKKIVPFKLRIKCKTRYHDMGTSHHCPPPSIALPGATSNDLIWYVHSAR